MNEISLDAWKKAQEGEKNYWYDFIRREGLECENKFFAMLLEYFGLANGQDLGNETLVDVGGGPFSILSKLKAHRRIVVDPLPMPTYDRTIERKYDMGENIYLSSAIADRLFMYNVLQHVRSPEKVLKECWRILKPDGFFYLLEQINDKTMDKVMHPHYIEAEFLDSFFIVRGADSIKRIIDKDCVMAAPKENPGCGCDLYCLVVIK